MDVITEFQHRNRMIAHDVANLQAVAQNALDLHSRDDDAKVLRKALASVVLRANTIQRKLHTPVKEA